MGLLFSLFPPPPSLALDPNYKDWQLQLTPIIIDLIWLHIVHSELRLFWGDG